MEHKTPVGRGWKAVLLGGVLFRLYTPPPSRHSRGKRGVNTHYFHFNIKLLEYEMRLGVI